MKYLSLVSGLILSTLATKISVYSPLNFLNDSTDPLSTFKDVLNSCEAKFTALIYQSSQAQDIENKLNKKTVATKLHLNIELSISKIQSEIKKSVKGCDAELEDHKQNYSVAQIVESPVVAKYYVESKADSLKLIDNIEAKHAKNYLIIVINSPSNTLKDKEHKTTKTPSETSEPTSTENPTGIPHKPYQDPFFWWVSAPIVLSLLLSLFLVVVLVIAISWLMALESPAFDKQTNVAKKTN